MSQAALEITVDHRSMIGKNFLWSVEKQGFRPGKVMTADHHDRELWEPYLKPWASELYF